MSFPKKVRAFLNEAKAQNIIDQDTNYRLQNFSRIYHGKSTFGSFLNIIGFFGALAIIIGFTLITSYNWSHISDLGKISGYIVTLIVLHYFAYRLRKKHPRISYILYFIVAGYILAGIVLIKQIYHLDSSDGKAFLLWFAMILPLAFVLRHKWIGIMSLCSFYVWLHINTNYYYDFSANNKSFVIYLTTISISMILLPRVAGIVNHCFDHIKFFGFGLLALVILAMGFGHEILPNTNEEIALHPVTISILIFNSLVLIYSFINKSKKEKFLPIPSRQISILLIILSFLPFLIYADFRMIISILYWIIWFYFSAILIYKGEAHESRWMVNAGTWCVVIGIIARFIDIVGGILFTGSMFILFGAILVIIAFVCEKYRKNLINKIFISHVK